MTSPDTAHPPQPMRARTASEHRLLALVESQLALPSHSIHAGTPISEVGDSLDWLELLMAVEDTFGVALDPVQTKSIRTVADLLQLLPPEAEGTLERELGEAVQRSLAGALPRPF